jgi:hypothetical protein
MGLGLVLILIILTMPVLIMLLCNAVAYNAACCCAAARYSACGAWYCIIRALYRAIILAPVVLRAGAKLRGGGSRKDLKGA